MKSNMFFLLIYFCFSIVIIFVGCASYPPHSTGVFPSGKDTYTVVLSGGRIYFEDLQKMAYQEANDFCEKQGKVLQPVSTKPDRNNYSFELQFRALYSDDPDYRRPVLEPVPDVKVDVKGK